MHESKNDIPGNLYSFEALFNYATIGIIVTDEKGIISNFNKQAKNDFGYTKEEVLGKPIEILIPPALKTKHEQYREGYYKNPTPRAMGHGRDLFAKKKDGSVFPVEVSLSNYTINDKLFVIAFVIDITVRKEHESVAVKQKEVAVGLARQHALHQRKDRGDAAAGGKADIDSRVFRCGPHAEAAGRRHHVELVAGFQLGRGPGRERPAIDLLHGNTQLAVVGAGADGIGAPHFLAIHGGAECEVLTGREGVIFSEVFGDIEGHRHRIRGFAAEIADGETMEARCGGGHQTLLPSLRAKRSNPCRSKRTCGLLRRFAPRNDGILMTNDT